MAHVVVQDFGELPRGGKGAWSEGAEPRGARHAGRHTHVGQRGAEVLGDVGLQNRVEVLELDVADERDDEDLEARRGQRATGSGPTSLPVSKGPQAHQRVEHQRVVRVLLRRLHHDVEERVQRVLQELGTRGT